MRNRLLISLTVAVLGAHLALLAWPGLRELMRTARITGSTPKELRFETRSISALPSVSEEPRPAAVPAPPKPKAPRPPPQAKPQKAPPEQAPESAAVVGPTYDARGTMRNPSALDGLLAEGSSAPDSNAPEAGAADTGSETASTTPAGPADTAESAPDSAGGQTTTSPASTDTAETAGPPAIGSPGYQGPWPPVRLPPSATLQFDAKGSAKGFQYSAKAQLQFINDGLNYQARQEVSAFLIGSRSQSSKGSITAHGLAPQVFGDKARSERTAHLDADKGQATFSGGDPQQPITAGVQDRLSIFLQLASMIAAGPGRYPKGSTISINVASARATDVWTFVVEGPETLELPEGPRATIRLARQPKKQGDQIAHLWIAPDLHYLPVRIKLAQANGDFADLQLKSATVGAGTAAN